MAIESISAIQYLDLQGTKTNVPAHSVVEVRLFQDFRNHIRVELLYENGDYSLIDAQALHILRNGGGKRDVKFVRTIPSGMRFPKLP
ncbi:MAG TPA: hypothetical protein ENI87_02625 [bacterium]|nr:hypothetical protein [bacterium]